MMNRENAGDAVFTGNSWQEDMVRCVNLIPKDVFSLEDVYAFEEALAQAYPNNFHIRDKVRQQLQVMRDNGLISFLGGGMYRKGSAER